MWIVTITYKVATSLTTLGTTDAVFNVGSRGGVSGAYEAYDRALEIFRMNEDTVNSKIVSFGVEYKVDESLLREDGTHKFGPTAEEWAAEARYNLVTEYTVMVTYTIDLLPDLKEQKQIFTWTNSMSHADAISKTEAVISTWKNASTIIKMEVESAEVETVDGENK